MWSVVAVAVAFLAFVVSSLQLYFWRKHNRLQAAFEHLRVVDTRLQETWGVSVDKAQKEILRCYELGDSPLPPSASAYLSFLNSVDLMAHGVRRGAVDREMASRYLKVQVRRSEFMPFIVQFRETCGSESADMYGEIEKFLEVVDPVVNRPVLHRIRALLRKPLSSAA